MIRLRKLLYLNSEELEKDNLARHLPSRLGGRHIQFIGSVSNAISIGFLLGYRNLVLFGVDLRQQHHFWEEGKPEFDRIKKTLQLHPSAGHSNGIGIQHFIWKINRDVFLPRDREIFVSNIDSLLYPGLRLWPEY
jgi:hypothetical protein